MNFNVKLKAIILFFIAFNFLESFQYVLSILRKLFQYAFSKTSIEIEINRASKLARYFYSIITAYLNIITNRSGYLRDNTLFKTHVIN